MYNNNNKFVKVLGADNLYRDMSTGAIINTDQTGIKSYQKKKESVRRQHELEDRVNHIESQIDDIKDMLSILIKQAKGD